MLSYLVYHIRLTNTFAYHITQYLINKSYSHPPNIIAINRIYLTIPLSNKSMRFSAITILAYLPFIIYIILLSPPNIPPKMLKARKHWCLTDGQIAPYIHKLIYLHHILTYIHLVVFVCIYEEYNPACVAVWLYWCCLVVV